MEFISRDCSWDIRRFSNWLGVWRGRNDQGIGRHSILMKISQIGRLNCRNIFLMISCPWSLSRLLLKALISSKAPFWIQSWWMVHCFRCRFCSQHVVLMMWRWILRGDPTYLSIKLFTQPLYLFWLVWIHTAAPAWPHTWALLYHYFLLCILRDYGSMVLDAGPSWVVPLWLCIGVRGDTTVPRWNWMTWRLWSLLSVDWCTVIIVRWAATWRWSERSWFLCAWFLILKLL